MRSRPLRTAVATVPRRRRDVRNMHAPAYECTVLRSPWSWVPVPNSTRKSVNHASRAISRTRLYGQAPRGAWNGVHSHTPWLLKKSIVFFFKEYIILLDRKRFITPKRIFQTIIAVVWVLSKFQKKKKKIVTIVIVSRCDLKISFIRYYKNKEIDLHRTPSANVLATPGPAHFAFVEFSHPKPDVWRNTADDPAVHRVRTI